MWWYNPFLLSGGGAFTITADAGSYTITGATASLEYGREIAADAGSYQITGSAASLEYGREAEALAGSYAITGADASLERGLEIAAAAGSYTISGSDATLIYATVGAFTIAAEPGSYEITGTAATLVYVTITPAATPAGGDSGDGTWWRSPRRGQQARGKVGTRPPLALDSEASVAPAPAQLPGDPKVPGLNEIKAQVAFEVDEILRQQARADRERRRKERARLDKADKQARAVAQQARKQEFARREAKRQRLAEEALAARLRALDDDDAIILAMCI